MATLVLSAVGASIGGAVGGGVLGISSAVIGRAVGATVGRLIDQTLLGRGSDVVETSRMEQVRVMGAREGAPIATVFGRTRLAGNVIWAGDFREHVTETRGSGKGAPRTREYGYSVSLAIGLCEGPIAGIGRVWANGAQIPSKDLNISVYRGDDEQLPDPVMEAALGEGQVPAYRGLAYVVIEDLDLGAFGNHVPQFNFEVIRHVGAGEDAALSDVVEAVALIPGSGEHALSAQQIFTADGAGGQRAANVNSARQLPDIVASLDNMRVELPKVSSTSLVVSWFGDDLRAGSCTIMPKAESESVAGTILGSVPERFKSGSGVPDGWSVSGATREQVGAVAMVDGRPVYGGTPSDASVISAIRHLNGMGQEVMFYPFILMEILEGNALEDPWSGEEGQPALPWRGRITTQRAPGREGSTDKTSVVRDEIDAFLGSASVSDFSIASGAVRYTGPDEWGYRRFVLHNAALCAAAGGVAAFCVGSELRSLTQLRDETGGFPMVEALRQLARDVRQILGEDTKIGYAADWSEYFGYHPQDGSGDVLFHLDPLWADDEIDFIGIDNYMPVSDWRGEPEKDDGSSLYDLAYLARNIRGGEGYDWFYENDEARRLQHRRDITDGAYGEPWVFRNKDLWNWWKNPHHNRTGGVRDDEPTLWVPQSKPIWFTEFGCAAIDKGTNQPNKFLDPKSSESSLPRFSNGRRDDYVQLQYYKAFQRVFREERNNPVSEITGERMLDLSRMFAWAWDARPWPEFPLNSEIWSDGANYDRGHWLSGRGSSQTLRAVVRALCERAGVRDVDVSRLHGVVRGFVIGDRETARASLQQLMLVYGFDAVERNGLIVFQPRISAPAQKVSPEEMIVSGDGTPVIEYQRASKPEIVGQVQVGYVDAGGDFSEALAQSRFPGDVADQTSVSSLSLVMTAQEARSVAERWLSEAMVARDSVRFALPPSRRDIVAGELVALPDGEGVHRLFRVDKLEDGLERHVEGTRVERQIYIPSDGVESDIPARSFAAPIRISAQFMDLPLLREGKEGQGPFVACYAKPWPGGAAVFQAEQDADYELDVIASRPATLGYLLSGLPSGQPDLWQREVMVRVRLSGGSLSSVSKQQVLNGANLAAIGNGEATGWEILQFEQAKLVAPETYELSGFLRGQLGSDGEMPDLWPVGSRFVLLDKALTQIDLEPGYRNRARHFRVGPPLRPYDDPSYEHYVEAFPMIGFKPYAPAHLRIRRAGDDYHLTWIRRTRVGGDDWEALDVPLGEEREAYLVRVLQDGRVVREEEVSSGFWRLEGAAASEHPLNAGFEVEVAQISARFGLGYFSRTGTDGNNSTY